MSTQKQRSVNTTEDNRTRLSTGGVPPEEQTEIDRLFAIAAASFDNLTQGDSEGFLRRSRQTGGQ
jgi:hypothetical protein